jgi:hypothetical protein
VQKGIADAVQQRQETLRVAETETIKTLQLDDGGEVEEKSSKIMRVMVVAAGLGLLLTAAFTIGIDALIRWRANRRRKDEGEDPTAPSVVGAAPQGGRGGGQLPSSFEKTQTVIISQPPAAASAGAAKPAEPHGARPGNGSNGKPSVPQPRRGTESTGTAYRSQQTAGNGPDPRAGSGPDPRSGNGPDPRLEQAPADATIVLPPWGWKHDDKKAERR